MRSAMNLQTILLETHQLRESDFLMLINMQKLLVNPDELCMQWY
jgi:hypothetical protein